jgi:hypothetical protein
MCRRQTCSTSAGRQKLQENRREQSVLAASVVDEVGCCPDADAKLQHSSTQAGSTHTAEQQDEVMHSSAHPEVKPL